MTLSSLINARWFRLLALTSAGLVLLLVALWLGPRLVDLESSRGAIVTQIEKQLGRRVALGRLSLRLLPRIEVRADEVRIAEDPAFGSGDFVLARVVRLRVGLWSLLRGRPELRGIELDAPQIVLIRRPNGSEPDWNWGSLRPLREPATTQDSGPLDLVVRDGRFTLIDRLVDPPVESTYSGIDVTLDRFSAKERFAVMLAVTMPSQNGQPGGRLELEGRVGPLATGDPLATPVEARVRLAQVGLAALEALAGSAPSGRTGRLTVDVELNGRLSTQLRARGTMRAEELRLVGDEAIAPSTTPLDLKFELTAASQSARQPGSQPGSRQINLQIEQAEIVLGATRLVTTGTIGLPTAVDASPIYDLSLNGQGINLESLLESAYAFGFGPPPGTKAAGQADLAMRIRNGDSAPQSSPPARPVLEGQLALRGLRFESRELTQPIEVTALNLEATPQALKFSPFRTALGSSTALEISRLELKDYRTAPLLELAAATNAARLEDLLRIAESFGLRPDLKGTGMVNLRIALAAALTPEPRVVSLTGAGKLSQASLETPRLTRPLNIANVDLNFTGDAARFENLALSLASSSLSGSLRVTNFARPQIGFDLRVDQLAVPEIRSILRDPPGGAGKSTVNDLTADGHLAIGQLKLDGLTAEKFDSKINLRNGLLTLDPLSLSIYGGVWRGAIRLDQTDIALKGQIAGVDVNQLLSRPGKSSPLFGRLDGRLDLRGRNKGGDAGDLISNLIGNGQVSITDGQIASFDLMKQVETIGRLVNLPTGGAATAFRQLRTNLRFDPGVLRTDALQIVMTDLTASGEGTIRFGEPGSVDYAILARLSPALTRRILSSRSSRANRANRAGTADDPAALATGESPAETTSGGTGVSQLFSSFFTEKDSLVIPLKISGPVNGPRFSLDAETLRRRATSSIFENLQQKILGPKGPTTPEKHEKSDEPRKPSPEEAIRGILDRLKKKKPGEQP